MKVVKIPQARLRAAIVRRDITPPVGVYHRMWGAALHDRATGIHRPLMATLLWMESEDASAPEVQILIALDHCILDSAELLNMRHAISGTTGVPVESILITMSHTHGSGWMSRTRSDLPGGELLGPYLDDLARQLAQLAKQAQEQVVAVRVVYGQGRCDLAQHRDFFDVERQCYVCGFNPDGAADDSLLVARITDASNRTLGTIVNYACHPTTLAWDNTLISPDWIGAMREVIEREEGGICLFLQGASGDLGPRDGFVGDTVIADRNGKKVGFAALAVLATLPSPGNCFCYAGPVISGTAIGTWSYQPLAEVDDLVKWRWERFQVDLPYRHDLPTVEQTASERENWLREEAKAREAKDLLRVRECRAHVEQRTRQLNRLDHLVPGRSYPLMVHVAEIGEALWVFVPGELYQMFQTTLRKELAPRPVFVITLTNDWQPGYIPPVGAFGLGIYQEVIAATAPGALELLTEQVLACLRDISSQNS